MVHCPGCRSAFDLFAAAWCDHREPRSKICPRCGACFCALPSYGEPALWKDAPGAFRREGFEKIFVGYL